jgi:hypothetical protein
MPGPTAWQQNLFVINNSVQTVVTNAETVIATLVGVTSRSPGGPINLTGFAAFQVSALTTATTLRVRIGSVTGTILNAAAPAITGTAGSTTTNTIDGSWQDQPVGEYNNQTYVLTIQSTAAGANWNVTLASLAAIF